MAAGTLTIAPKNVLAGKGAASATRSPPTSTRSSNSLSKSAWRGQRCRHQSSAHASKRPASAAPRNRLSVSQQWFSSAPTSGGSRASAGVSLCGKRSRRSAAGSAGERHAGRGTVHTHGLALHSVAGVLGPVRWVGGGLRGNHRNAQDRHPWRGCSVWIQETVCSRRPLQLRLKDHGRRRAGRRPFIIMRSSTRSRLGAHGIDAQAEGGRGVSRATCSSTLQRRHCDL